MLVVYGLVELHRDTSEWSAQGLGNTLAGLVEAGWRSGRGVVVLEERKVGGEDHHPIGDPGEGDETGERMRIKTGWNEGVPMLNGSVRRAGMESEDAGWSGRTVEVGRILSRWFKFERTDWES